METYSALLALRAGFSSVTGEFPTQRPVTRSFDVFFDLRLNKRLIDIISEFRTNGLASNPHKLEYTWAPLINPD